VDLAKKQLYFKTNYGSKYSIKTCLLRAFINITNALFLQELTYGMKQCAVTTTELIEWRQKSQRDFEINLVQRRMQMKCFTYFPGYIISTAFLRLKVDLFQLKG